MTNISLEFLLNLVQLLSDDALQQLGKAINSEEVRRSFLKVQEGKHQPLNEKELQLVKDGYKVEAILQYCERVGCTKQFAMTVVYEHSSFQESMNVAAKPIR